MIVTFIYAETNDTIGLSNYIFGRQADIIITEFYHLIYKHTIAKELGEWLTYVVIHYLFISFEDLAGWLSYLFCYKNHFPPASHLRICYRLNNSHIGKIINHTLSWGLELETHFSFFSTPNAEFWCEICQLK
ncbi:hypothetical protein EGR_05495 [Echinococcus granulosus]|uniref:Uncharacterized protein n=1 Tax=Echinococcus granulosus TaxID=6210 RepID=W6UFE2_ECHGR|nr:hypothetical protein EGR_05495 [Echinococcus granulosus]EUB59596.1 hypothetical protein EGR_05495 [Echinococcus granulosus]